MVNFNLTDEQIEVRNKARGFALKEVLPLAWYYDEKDESPLPVMDIRRCFP